MLTARRQASTTSLSKYVRTNSPILQDRNLDFCNAFWGLGDGGVDVLFARMRGATRTVEELRNFWKERASIEEDYAKRMNKLSKATLGRDEIGDMRIALDTVKLETEHQAQYHQGLAHHFRTELESGAAAFHARQLQHKKQNQAPIEKEFKNKQAQEAHGKDLEKIQVKLERAQQTVLVNEKEFCNFAKILHETTQKWEQSWKGFCDSCQDLEEQRLEFMKDNMWTYTNEVSTVCVSDDESCEKIRLALEQMEPDREMENFVRDYGTGNEMPSPPQFVNYNTPDAIPSSASRPATRPADFVRSSTRELFPRDPVERPAEDEPPVNTAGVGAGGGSRQSMALDVAGLQGHDARGRNSVSPVNGYGQPHTNGVSSAPPNPSPEPPNGWNTQRKPTVTAQPPSSAPRLPHDPMAEPIDPNAETYIKVGNNAYKVDLSRDPQQQRSLAPINRSAPASPVKLSSSPVKQDGTIDPLQRQLQELQNAVSATGSTRRNTMHRPPTAEQKSTSPAPHSPAAQTQSLTNAPKSLLPPGQPSTQGNRSPSPSRDYRNSADLVVGSHPSAPASSRPASPNPPTAAVYAPSHEAINDVLADYQQSLPGERKSISRNNSANRGRPTSAQPQGHAPHRSDASINLPAQVNNLNQGQGLQRPTSGMGHAGVGAYGGSRSNSPLPQSRGPSPAPNASRNTLVSPAQNIARAPSPNSVGIALDPSGRVMHDELAQGYQQPTQARRQSQPPPQHPQQQQRPPQQLQQPSYHPPAAPSPQQQQQQPAQRRASYVPPVAAPPATVIATPPAPQMYGVTPPPPPPSNVNLLYQQQQAAAPPQQPIGYQQPPPQQAPPNPYGTAAAQRNSAGMNGFYDAPPQQQQQAPYSGQRQLQQQPQQGLAQPAYQQAPQQQQQWNRGTSPAAAVRRSPSPQPPQPTTTDGSTILFYVQALYDYSATIDEEFDFQAGDIIAGRNVFPSNFVCLF
ncbi:SH3 domain-containing protein [Ephemerocybe angulata]|uniref:SH3 domain-containing protein n=1 Tax=Ephemerocybe angulata TaxID=980116 RepID=A0A8H6MCE7_9AGAR|nr:SH3 domain-containing protein [Tulosesus angulatus]